ncbi:MAG: hypothetical protein J0L75_01555 [Spirochaetes bacterium]|nr:hypothetical protein [Spirochaetota bacterium]
MRQYYQVAAFDDRGGFFPRDLERMVELGRRNFFIFFPRVCRLEEISSFAAWLSNHVEVRFCVHDKNLLHPDNEYTLGRNLAFYVLLNRHAPHVESVSYHFGSLYGFGVSRHSSVIQDLAERPLEAAQERERFFCATYDFHTYLQFMRQGFELLHPMSAIARDAGIRLLVKNLCLDYILLDKKTEAPFIQKGYPLEAVGGGASFIPGLLEKGDFPRYTRELTEICREHDVGLSLDMEYFRNLVLLSRKFNVKNEALMRLWKIELNHEHRESLETHGFLVEPGKPVFYERELDLYDQILDLSKKVDIAHLSGSIGPCFVDKEDLKPDDVTPDLLLGLVGAEDIPRLVPGKKQLSAIDGYDDKARRRNFTHDASQKIWQDQFKRQFSEDIFLLKEIGCDRVVQKMKDFSEKAARTFEMFNILTDLELGD